MTDLGQKFLAAALGNEGANALKKAVEHHPELVEVLIPRTIVGWLSFTTDVEYEGVIPGIENSYVQFQKNDDGSLSGAIGLEDGVYSFEKSSVYHLAASIAVALNVESSDVDPGVRDTVLVRLGKSIDTLAKAQVLMQELKNPKTLQSTRLTTHGAYHVEHSGPGEQPYRVVHTKSKSPVQAGIRSLKDGQQIAQWHQNKYGGEFSPPMNKKALDPNAGITFSHQHHDLGDGEMLTHVKAIHPAGHVIGETVMEHKPGNTLKPADVQVHPDHRRQGIASAMYAHAQNLTGKTVQPSTAQTSAGQALWSGNAKAPQFGKVELPGQTAKPQKQQGPIGPMPPMKQPANAQPKKPKLPNLAVGKSEALTACGICGETQFEGHRFRGCLCFRDLSKSVKTTAYGDGYVLEFKPSMDADAVRAIVKALRPKDG